MNKILEDIIKRISEWNLEDCFDIEERKDVIKQLQIVAKTGNLLKIGRPDGK